MITDTGLPAGRATVMIMIWLMPSAAARKDIPKPPAPKATNLLTTAPMTILILKNVLLSVPQTTSLAKNHITASVRHVTENMLPVNARPAAQVMITPSFLTVMFRTVRLA